MGSVFILKYLDAIMLTTTMEPKLCTCIVFIAEKAIGCGENKIQEKEIKNEKRDKGLLVHKSYCK